MLDPAIGEPELQDLLSMWFLEDDDLVQWQNLTEAPVRGSSEIQP